MLSAKYLPLLASVLTFPASASAKSNDTNTPSVASSQDTTTTTAQNRSYKPLLQADGVGFFTHFNFFTDADPTHGSVQYVDLVTANTSGLIGTISVSSPLDGAVYLGVDHTTKTSKRPSVRLESKETFGKHLLIADVLHMPSACGVWPALWELGPNPWPVNGEIDVIENVHNSTANRMSLHTKDDMIIVNHTTSMTGQFERDNCAADAENIGCTVLDQDTANSAGQSFNDALGGVYTSEFSDSGVSIWFFPREKVPEDIKNGVPSPEEWGKPNAMFMVDGEADWGHYFKDLRVVINTTFCGAWAGKVWAASECGHLADTCEEYVENNPQAFVDAYWAIRGMGVYGKM